MSIFNSFDFYQPYESMPYYRRLTVPEIQDTTIPYMYYNPQNSWVRNNFNTSGIDRVSTEDRLEEEDFTLKYPEQVIVRTPQLPELQNSSTVHNTLKFTDKKAFCKTMYNAYVQELSRRGLDTRHAAVLVAQDALESGWGAKAHGDYNFGNIITSGNKWHKKTGNRKWRDYNSILDYVKSKVDLLSNKRYRYFTTFSGNSNVATAMQVLANRGYCPNSPGYGTSVAKTYNRVLQYLN